MELIGAGLCVAGTLLLASMWFSKRGGDIVSHRDAEVSARRDPLYARDRVSAFDAEPRRTL